MHAVYRSPAARYFLAAVAVAAGLLFVFGDPAKWQSSQSFVFLSHVPGVPLDVWGWLTVAYGLLLIPSATRSVGYALGAFLFAVAAVCLLSTIGGAGPKNVWAVIGVIDAMVYHLLAIRFAIADRLTP